MLIGWFIFTYQNIQFLEHDMKWNLIFRPRILTSADVSILSSPCVKYTRGITAQVAELPANWT
jgi:hypothetical protein